MEQKNSENENPNDKPKEKGMTSEILDEISNSLSAQIQMELESQEKEAGLNEVPFEADNIGNESGDSEEVSQDKIYRERPQHRGLKFTRLIGTFVLGMFFIVGLSLLIKYSVQVGNVLGSINYIDDDKIEYAETDITDETPVVTKTPVPIEEVDETSDSERVVNILLVGEENLFGDTVGRSDSMMIATINGKQKTLKLTSLMRDIYIAIPGYMPNKLNAAYNNGGGKLLTETIEMNFGIPIDGYVSVNFDGLIQIIDILGGVEVTLTSDEAYYLNTTNYIKEPMYRNVSAGTSTLNGHQAVGYCRVRYRTASNGEANDFGRTWRQRTVLSALFDKYKDKSITEMIDIANQLIPYVSTNLSKAKLLDYVSLAASLRTTELEQLRIPVDRTYFGRDVPCGHSIGDALTIDYDENIRIMRNFIYGTDRDGEDAVTTPSAQPDDGTDKDTVGYYDEYGNYHTGTKPSTNAGDFTPGDDYIPHYETYGNY